jgi:hydroxymethylbilane synthase
MIYAPDGSDTVAGEARFAIGDDAAPKALAADLLARAPDSIRAVFDQ